MDALIHSFIHSFIYSFTIETIFVYMTGDYMTDFLLHGLKAMYGDEVLIKMTMMHDMSLLSAVECVFLFYFFYNFISMIKPSIYTT